MISEEVTIAEHQEMDVRRIALLVQKAGSFQSDIFLEKGGRRINAKSLMGTMAIGMCGGEGVRIFCAGNDETVALSTMKAFLSA